jgi:hypothetical protein
MSAHSFFSFLSLSANHSITSKFHGSHSNVKQSHTLLWVLFIALLGCSFILICKFCLFNIFTTALSMILVLHFGVRPNRFSEETDNFDSQITNTFRMLALAIINLLNAKLNPICHLLALLAHHILYVSRIRVNCSGAIPENDGLCAHRPKDNSLDLDTTYIRREYLLH